MFTFISSQQIIHFKNHTYRILSSSYKYNSRGSYLNFAFFNVEQRSRVLLIDFLYGKFLCEIKIEVTFLVLDIPVSSQWQSSGHLYPIQIAQFGLSHWSRLEFHSKIKHNDIHRFETMKRSKTV